MTPLLFQGIPGLPDASAELRAQQAQKSLVPGPSFTQRVAEGDKLHEECGVTAIHNHPDAARQAYLALYALQHRGQESAGIATADGQHLANIKGMGLVSEIFTEDVLDKLPGHMAIGHTRYSTTGDSALLNAQPIRV
ncbi:MAG TPA: amidophosphoribosyltransferase, partial [Terracidiphilus sp.]|nr:amidophosphoribosyltransferase [Terracidiphilus sp.]